MRVGDVAITGRIDRVDEREWVAEALIWDYKSGAVGALGANVLERGRLQMPLYIRAAAELLGRDVVGGLYQSVRGDEAPRGLLREDVREAGRWRASRGATTWSPSCSRACSTRRPSAPASTRGACRRGTSSTTRRAASARPGAAGTASAGWRTRERAIVQPVLSEQQTAAVEARGEIVVAAGAGTGKTTLVIERVRAALAAGTAPERVLVVTYTEAAARELAVRLERALPAGADVARPQVGTIHALASRLLREYAAEAGLPAELRVLDEAEALVLSEAAFADAIARERRDGPSVLLDLLGEYGVAGSRA